MDAQPMPREANLQALWDSADDATILLRAISNENRLMILCLLTDGERSVGEIESMIGARQPTVSQQLARLRADGLVEARRDGKAIYYTLICSRMRRLLESLDDLYGVSARRGGGEQPAPKRVARG